MAYDPRDLEPSPDTIAADVESAPPVYNWRWFTTSLVILAALLILELGIHPAFAAVMLCFKLSLPDLLNAWWLVRRDPDRSRGTLVAAFYVARSFWSVVVWSFLLAGVSRGPRSLSERWDSPFCSCLSSRAASP